MDEVPELFSSTAKSQICHGLEKYFQVGGFPDVQNRDSVSWVGLLQNYVNVVLLRDVAERYKIANTTPLKYILQKVFNTPGGKFSANKLHRELKGKQITIDRENISRYIEYFCRAYLLYAVPYHTDSVVQKNVNPAKLYMIDVGMIRAMNSKQSADNGLLLENLVFLHLRRKGYAVEYLETKSGYEIDFIAYHKLEREYHIVQTCFGLGEPNTFEREIRAILDVRDYTSAKDCTIVTWDEERTLDNGIKIVPAWKYLLDRY